MKRFGKYGSSHTLRRVQFSKIKWQSQTENIQDEYKNLGKFIKSGFSSDHSNRTTNFKYRQQWDSYEYHIGKSKKRQNLKEIFRISFFE